jgi:hypothetical protein
MTERLIRFFNILLFAFVCFLGMSALSQEGRPLSISDIENLLGGKVGQERVANLIRERGVNFQFDQAAKLRLGNAGVGASLMKVVEKAAAEYAQKQTQEPQIGKTQEVKQKAAEASRIQEEAKRKELEAKRLEESRKRELEQRPVIKTEQARGPEIDPKNPVAPAPACAVGLRLDYRYENGQQFSREIKKTNDGLCSVGRYSYDNKWVLAKVVDLNGREVYAANLLFPLIGQSWLAFPLSVGKQWHNTYYANHKTGGVSRSASYTDRYTVLAYEKVSVPAGNFIAFKIRLRQDAMRAIVRTPQERLDEPIYGSRYFWYVPEIGYFVKQKSPPEEASSNYFWSSDTADWGDDDFELVSINRSQ